MGRSVFLPALVAMGALGSSAWSARAEAQEPPELPPPPPPKSAPQYTPPPQPVEQPSTTPAPSRRERDQPSRRDRDRERERERERERAAAAARQAPPPPPPPVEREREPSHSSSIPFQAAVRTGVSLPGGNLEGGANGSHPMSDYFDFQVPVVIEAGFKIHPMILLGAYGAFALGAVSQHARNLYCDNRSCTATSFRVGAQIQAQFRPGERLNPWASYGLGFESNTASASDGPNNSGGSVTYSGFEFARLAAGLDFRVSHLFGVGPFVEVAFGSYGHVHSTGGLFSSSVATDAGITDTALHDWVTFGIRGVLFP